MKADFYTYPQEVTIQANEQSNQDVGGEKPKTDDEEADA